MLRFAFVLLFGCSLFAQNKECPVLLKKPSRERRFGQQRRQAIKGWDQLLTWALTPQYKPYKRAIPYVVKSYEVESELLLDFPENYGYFSIHHPIVGMVTESERDIVVTGCLLDEVHESLKDREQLSFTTHEILAKVLAYRSLKKGMHITFSNSKEKLQTYVVDEVIDLWRGMPAFGLIPSKKNGIAPILLFRGTDLNLTTEKSWASVLSDLDPNGPGLSTFLGARTEIHNWLKKMKESYGPARAMGFSLGGVFVYYTLFYEGSLLHRSQPSVAFNPPGISEDLLAKWNGADPKLRPPIVTYVNQGDFVSQIGFLLSPLWVASLNEEMGVITSHTMFISGQPSYELSKVDVPATNKERK